MKIYKVLIAALAVFSVCLDGDLNAQEKSGRKLFGRKSPTKKELVQENQRMRSMIDSLMLELQALEDTAYVEEEYVEEGKSYSLLDGVAPETYSQEVTDSLLNIWYLHRQAKNCVEGVFDMDSVHFTSNVPDKVLLERLSKMNSYITLPFNETVKNYMLLYAEKMPTKMAHMLALASYYFPIFEETLSRYGMPIELKYMAVIESALNPVAVSRAGAKGMWQFMYTTARNYGLEINSYVDERLDPFKAVDAAARYMYDSYRIFGDWNLAISSYNCGAGNVNKAIKRCGGNKDFWSVYEYLPRETRGYVPAFVGAMYAFTYYKEHGITPDPVQMPAHLDTFQISRMLHFQQIQDLTGISVQELRDLNPQYVHDIIPGNLKTYILRLPFKYSGKFIEVEDSVYTHRAKELFNPATLQNIASSSNGNRITYRVKSGDYLGRIASRYHVSVAQLKKWNHLRSNNLRVGQILVIYGRGGGPVSNAGSAAAKSSAGTSAKSGVSGSASASGSKSGSSTGSKSGSSGVVGASGSKAASSGAGSAKSGSAGTKAASSATAAGSYTIYTVKAGDTLYSIAKAYPGVSANDIMKFNGISTNIMPGMKIKIPKL